MGNGTGIGCEIGETNLATPAPPTGSTLLDPGRGVSGPASAQSPRDQIRMEQEEQDEQENKLGFPSHEDDSVCCLYPNRKQKLFEGRALVLFSAVFPELRTACSAMHLFNE